MAFISKQIEKHQYNVFHHHFSNLKQMNKMKLTPEQAYLAMYFFLNKHFSLGCEELGGILGSADFFETVVSEDKTRRMAAKNRSLQGSK